VSSACLRTGSAPRGESAGAGPGDRSARHDAAGTGRGRDGAAPDVERGAVNTAQVEAGGAGYSVTGVAIRASGVVMRAPPGNYRRRAWSSCQVGALHHLYSIRPQRHFISARHFSRYTPARSLQAVMVPCGMANPARADERALGAPVDSARSESPGAWSATHEARSAPESDEAIDKLRVLRAWTARRLVN
jgi:hypothetical protein